jgi:hypothetical protein
VILAESLGSNAVKGAHIFTTDVSEENLEIARAGIYPHSIFSGVSRERLDRFFDGVETGFKAKDSLRSLCVFTKHNLISDPPFSRVDLISCRNLLIYFDPALPAKTPSISTLRSAAGLARTPAQSRGVQAQSRGVRSSPMKSFRPIFAPVGA